MTTLGSPTTLLNGAAGQTRNGNIRSTHDPLILSNEQNECLQPLEVADPVIAPSRSVCFQDNSCDYIRVERVDENAFFLYGADNPAQTAGASNFVVAYAILQTGFVIVTYFFLLHYWQIPYLFIGMVLAHLFLHFVLFLYSDYFCRLAFTIYWRCPSSTTVRFFLCSVCDWLLTFSFFVSWCSAVAVLAPVFSTWRKLSNFPIAKNVYVSSVTPDFLDAHSFIFFHPSVGSNSSTASAMLIQAAVPPLYADDPMDDVLEFKNAVTFPTSLQFKHTTYLQPIRQGVEALFRKTLDKKLFRSLDRGTPSTAEKVRKSPSYAHRIWPNLWLGGIANSTVGAVLLQDSWSHRHNLKGEIDPNTPRLSRNTGLKTVSLAPPPYVWSVCSDAATLSCSCHSFSVARALLETPRCKETGGLCGIELPHGMPAQASITRLVQEIKKLHNLSRHSADMFLCLQNEPTAFRESIHSDVRWSAILGTPFGIGFTFVALRLLYYYICQSPIRNQNVLDTDDAISF